MKVLIIFIIISYLSYLCDGIQYHKNKNKNKNTNKYSLLERVTHTLLNMNGVHVVPADLTFDPTVECRICPSLFYNLKPHPWIPKTFSVKTKDGKTIQVPSVKEHNPYITHSFISFIAAKATRTEPPPCCIIGQELDDNDPEYPDLLKYPEWIAETGPMEKSGLEGHPDELEMLLKLKRYWSDLQNNIHPNKPPPKIYYSFKAINKKINNKKHIKHNIKNKKELPPNKNKNHTQNHKSSINTKKQRIPFPTALMKELEHLIKQGIKLSKLKGEAQWLDMKGRIIKAVKHYFQRRMRFRQKQNNSPKKTVPCCAFCPLGCPGLYEAGPPPPPPPPPPQLQDQNLLEIKSKRHNLRRHSIQSGPSGPFGSMDMKNYMLNAKTQGPTVQVKKPPITRHFEDYTNVPTTYNPPGMEPEKPDVCDLKILTHCCRICQNAWNKDLPEWNWDHHKDLFSPPFKKEDTQYFDDKPFPMDKPDAIYNNKLLNYGGDLPWRQSPEVEESIRYRMQNNHDHFINKDGRPPTRFDLNWIFEDHPNIFGA